MLSQDVQTSNTARLLKEVYYGSTPQKRMEAVVIRRELRKELSAFKEYVRCYQEAEGEEKEDLLYLLKQELNEKSAFTAFKRWLIIDNRERFAELIIFTK